MSAPLLELAGVQARFGATVALDDVSIAVRAGTTLGVVGESGSGKSTLARLIVGLERPRHGELRFRGRPYPRGARGLRAIRRQVAMIFQDPYDSLDPRFTLRKLVDEPLRAQRLPRGDARVAELLRDVGMEGAPLDSYPAEYSGGQRQRIGIARALASEPALLVCDEPTSALDVSVQAQILNLLLDLQRERGLTYVFISHDLDVVRRMSDELVVIHRGRVVEAGPTAAVCASPAHDHTRALLAAAPVSHPALRGGSPAAA
jgi:ABC-type glutathione transport system ATPase component